MNYPRSRFAFFQIVMASAFWGLGSVLMKRALAETDPFSLNAMMLLGSILLLWGILVKQKTPIQKDRNLFWLALLGLLHPGLVSTVGSVGLEQVSVSVFALIQASQPAMIIVLAWLILRERPGTPLILLTVMAGLGVFLIIGGELSLGSSTIFGSLMIGTAALLASLSLVLISRMILTQPPLGIVAIQQTSGLVLVLGVLFWTWIHSGSPDPGLLKPVAWGWGLAAGTTFFGIGFWIFYEALKSVPARIAAPFISLIPIFALAGGYLLLGERLQWAQWIGSGLTITAVTLIALKNKG